MVVSEALPGLEIAITVDGIPLYEHRDPNEVEEDEPRTTTRYLEVTSGQVFAISIKVLPHFQYQGDCIAFNIRADGELVADPVIRRTDTVQAFISEGPALASGKVNKYTFADIELCEEFQDPI